jgi:hypothetical protein
MQAPVGQEISLLEAAKMAYNWFFREGDGPSALEVHVALGRAIETAQQSKERNYLIESVSDEAGEVYERKI